VKNLTAKIGKKGKASVLEADKGCDAQRVRIAALKNKAFPLIPYRKGSKAETGLCDLEKFRWKVERTIAWLKTRYRRISTRWERRVKYWNSFLQFALIKILVEVFVSNTTFIGRLIRMEKRSISI